MPRGGNIGTIEMITASILPEVWEQLGGVSTISSVNHSQEGRPALLISTTDDVHKEVEDLMQALRETHSGSDPRLSDEEIQQQKKAPHQPSWAEWAVEQERVVAAECSEQAPHAIG